MPFPFLKLAICPRNRSVPWKDRRLRPYVRPLNEMPWLTLTKRQVQVSTGSAEKPRAISEIFQAKAVFSIAATEGTL